MKTTKEDHRRLMVEAFNQRLETTKSERYKLFIHGPFYHISKWVPFGESQEKGFWQQISPNYIRKGNALRYATKHNLKLENN